MIDEIQYDSFWSKVNIKDNSRECWEWMGAKKPKGYGNVRINRKYLLSHRVAFEIVNGKIPDGYIVCHICDNPSCCNPNHLMLGTHKSNVADMLIKNRQKKYSYATRMEKNVNAKLTKEKVMEIRNLYENKILNQYELAKKYSVSQTCIGYVVRRKTWTEI